MIRSAATRLLTAVTFVFTCVLNRRVPVRVLCRSRSLFVATFACCVAMLWANAASASVSYTTAGGSYTQDFNSLPIPTTGTSNTTNNNIQTATNGGFTNGWK